MEEPLEEPREEAADERREQSRRGFIELLAGLTGVAQERLARTLDDVMTKGEAARDDVRRNAFRTLFPDEAERLEGLQRRVDILEAKVAESSIVAGPRPDAQRRTGFSSTAEVPDDKVTGHAEH
ncbi:MAG TPA: hypothetical protein VJ787_13275 [Thermoleophilia bacterium]|nr:hypothetical protein [Thermoleophilia bacterium]